MKTLMHKGRDDRILSPKTPPPRYGSGDQLSRTIGPVPPHRAAAWGLSTFIFSLEPGHTFQVSHVHCQPLLWNTMTSPGMTSPGMTSPKWFR